VSDHVCLGCACLGCARLARATGETVLILGATGVTGKLAIQMAKLLGAGPVIAAGRNEQVLNTLHDLGADATIHLGKPDQDRTEAFVGEAGDTGFDVIIDYLWGLSIEALFAAIARRDLKLASSRARLVEVGESAGLLFRYPTPCCEARGGKFLEPDLATPQRHPRCGSKLFGS